MGREVRMVPADWEHPKKYNEYRREMCYIPLMGFSFTQCLKNWEEGKAQWEKGFREDYSAPYGGPKRWKPFDGDKKNMSYEEWTGERPKKEDYMPEWPDEERTHYQMYEDTSEGTPISPVFADPHELAHWLADNGASSFADMTASYESWLSLIIGNGYSVGSCVITNGKIIDGVTATKSLTEEK